MHDLIQTLLRTVLIGAGATLTMDAWAWVLRRLGIPSLNFAFLGRWIGNWFRGTWFHESIARAPAIPGELVMGWTAHYLIGISFAGLLIGLVGPEWLHSPTPLAALVLGAVSVVAPWFVLQPALGAGIASSKTANPVSNALKSLVTHLVFGGGLYLAALLLAAI